MARRRLTVGAILAMVTAAGCGGGGGQTMGWAPTATTNDARTISSIVEKSGTARPPMLIRATDCFERRDGRWRITHEHVSLPAGGGWDGTTQTGD